MAKKQSATQPTFEQAMEKLEQITIDLEDGELGLSDAMLRYEEGVKHLKECYGLLQRAERKIELLSGVDAEGNPITEPFDDEELSLEEKAASRAKRRSRPVKKTGAKTKNSADDDMDEAGKLF